jgi:hypothetical protein
MSRSCSGLRFVLESCCVRAD